MLAVDRQTGFTERILFTGKLQFKVFEYEDKDEVRMIMVTEIRIKLISSSVHASITEAIQSEKIIAYK